MRTFSGGPEWRKGPHWRKLSTKDLLSTEDPTGPRAGDETGAAESRIVRAACCCTWIPAAAAASSIRIIHTVSTADETVQGRAQYDDDDDHSGQRNSKIDGFAPASQRKKKQATIKE